MCRYLFPPLVSDARALRPGGGVHREAEGREGEGRGRPTREVSIYGNTLSAAARKLAP
jgi:hypothetical protein